jgi:hypothetical protein
MELYNTKQRPCSDFLRTEKPISDFNTVHSLASEQARGAGKRKEEKRRLFEANNSQTAGSLCLIIIIYYSTGGAFCVMRRSPRFVVICNGKESRKRGLLVPSGWRFALSILLVIHGD